VSDLTELNQTAPRFMGSHSVISNKPRYQIFENLTLVQSPAIIDANAIQQCLFCAEAMTFLKTMQTLVTAKNKTDSGSGSGFSQMFDYGSNNKRRILRESTPNPWPPLLGSITHKQSAAQN